jgi:hypothetical protein
MRKQVVSSKMGYTAQNYFLSLLPIILHQVVLVIIPQTHPLMIE